MSIGIFYLIFLFLSFWKIQLKKKIKYKTKLIDASFSLDGVLGAFALSHDIIIITLGLCIGAIFVRSLTVMLVEKKTLKSFVYLESGAHWAIGILAIIMFISTYKEIPEVVTAVSGLLIILASLYSSVKYNKQEEN